MSAHLGNYPHEIEEEGATLGIASLGCSKLIRLKDPRDRCCRKRDLYLFPQKPLDHPERYCEGATATEERQSVVHICALTKRYDGFVVDP